MLDVQTEQFSRRQKSSIYWFNKSADLRGSAAAIWHSMTKERSAEIALACNLGQGFDLSIACRPIYLMLCGMSLELMYKAICVATRTKFAPTHRLSDLATLAGVSFNKDDK